MRVLGIDPGTWKIGLAVIDQEKKGLRAVHYETIVLQDAKNRLSLARRLKKIYDSLMETFKVFKPDVAALEDIFYSLNLRTATRIGEARAVAILAATNFNVDVVEYSPARIKQAISGNGQASKIQMQYMVRHLLKLRENPDPDEADALAVAICHCHSNPTKRLLQEVAK